MAKQGCVAFDLGAESGRAMLAMLDGGRLQLVEGHRFANRPQRLPSGLHWDLVGLWGNLLEGLGKCAAAAKQQGVELVSLGVDTWGVDCGYIGKSGQLLGLPFAYRDSRCPPAMRKTIKKLGARRLYEATGLQFLPFNTLYQLVAQWDSEPAVLKNARHLLLMPDLLHYFFTGKAANEATIASTSQMINPRTGGWDKALLKALGLPTHFLGPIVPAGTKLGKLLPGLAKDLGIAPLQVIAPGSHDTASAVAAVPVDAASGQSWAYLSSGTWSLMGAELDEPTVTEASRKAAFTNEGGVGGKIRFLKNIAGLWLVQECRRDLARLGQEYSYEQLADLAARAPAFRTLVNPNYAAFASPGEMLAKIDRFAAETGQPKPDAPGAYVRACLESLALCYRLILDDLESLLGRRVAVLHIVGGGGKNALLNQMTADAIGRPVVVGPYEATAIGNALTQAIGAGAIKNLAELRQVVRQSFDVLTVQPQQPAAFEAQRERFEDLFHR